MFKKIDERSQSSLHSGFNLFTVPTTNTSVEKSYFREVFTSNPINNNGPYIFNVKSDTAWLDISKSFIFLELGLQKLQAGQWVQTEEADNVGVIQAIGKTFFNDIKVTLNGTQISSDNQLYAYKAYFETEFMCSEEIKKTRLELCGYDSFTKAKTMGQEARAKKYASKESVQLISNLHIDLATTDKFLINNSELMLELTRNSDGFCLHALKDKDETQYRIQVVDIRFYVKTVLAYSGLNVSLLTALSKNPSKYPMRKVCMTTLYGTPGSFAVGPAEIFPDKIPRRLIIAMTDKNAFVGEKKSNPFIFKHNDLRESDKSNAITCNQFCDSHCLFCINLCPAQEDSSELELIKAGSTILHMIFNTAIPVNGFQVIIYGEFDSMLTVDGSRTVLIDGKAG